jgi:hypothetical protein
MASTSEATWGAKVANAETLATYLQSFTAYAPPNPQMSVTNYQTAIATAKTLNQNTATALQVWSAAIDARQQIFFKAADSLKKILSPIGATVRASFGKTSKQAADIAAIINKIRGEKIKTQKKDSSGEFISQSERSYGSITQSFADIITTLQGYGTGYNPINAAITIVALQAKLTAINTANTNVASAYSQLKQKRDNRLASYTDLSQITQKIKDAVKSQYGQVSTEYVLIKGLKV